MCDTCLTKLHAKNAFIGRVPRVQDLIPWDTAPAERERLENHEREMLIAWSSYTANLMGFAGNHQPKERKNGVKLKQAEEVEDVSPLEEPEDEEQREEVA